MNCQPLLAPSNLFTLDFQDTCGSPSFFNSYPKTDFHRTQSLVPPLLSGSLCPPGSPQATSTPPSHLLSVCSFPCLVPAPLFKPIIYIYLPLDSPWLSLDFSMKQLVFMKHSFSPTGSLLQILCLSFFVFEAFCSVVPAHLAGLAQVLCCNQLASCSWPAPPLSPAMAQTQLGLSTLIYLVHGKFCELH